MRTTLSTLAMVVAALVALAPTSTAVGLLGTYYSYAGPYLEDFTFSDPGYAYEFGRVDAELTFGWSTEQYTGNNSNGSGFDWEPFGPDGGAFGVKWDGWITIPDGEELFLGTESDDGSYVFVDGDMFIDNGGQHYPTYSWSDDPLASGRYRIEVYLFGNDLTPPDDKSGLDLWWSPEQAVVDDSGWVDGDALDPVPEPATLALLLGGLGVSAAVERRRRRS